MTLDRKVHWKLYRSFSVLRVIYLGHMDLNASVNLCFQFAMLESVLTGIVDCFPGLRSKKTLVMLAISVVFYILGLPMTTPVNQYIYFLKNPYH